MQNFEYYRLEISCDKNDRKFTFLEYLSLILKIVALLLLVPLIKYFYLSISLWGLSILVNVFKRNLIYKYVYTISDGILIVEKEFNYDKRVLCEEIDLSKAAVILEESGTKYYENVSDMPITIENVEKKFSIDVDEYFYAIVSYYCKQGEEK